MSIYVKPAEGTTEAELRALFGECGEVKKVDIKEERTAFVDQGVEGVPRPWPRRTPGAQGQPLSVEERKGVAIGGSSGAGGRAQGRQVQGRLRQWKGQGLRGRQRRQGQPIIGRQRRWQGHARTGANQPAAATVSLAFGGSTERRCSCRGGGVRKLEMTSVLGATRTD